jgi:hypothetical protein
MTTTINEEKQIELSNGAILTVRPLKLSLLRLFMKKFESLSAVAEDNDKSLDVLLECVKIALKQYNPELAEAKDLEDILDLPTVYKIVEEASGIKLGDTDLLNSIA